MIHAMSVKKANKGKKEKEDSCSDQADTDCGSQMMENVSNSTDHKLERVLERSHRQAEHITPRPTRIEEVPFRNQDRRTLNARYRRIMDRKLILFILSCGSLLLGLGTGLLVLHYIFKEEYSHIRPFVIIGPVLIGGGVMVIIFSFEVCIR